MKPQPLRFGRRQGSYSTQDVLRGLRALGLDVPRRTIADLPRQNLVHPDVFDPGGRLGPAYPARWSYDNFRRIAAIFILRRRAGFSMHEVRMLIDEHGDELFAGLKAGSRKVLIVDRRKNVVIKNDDGAEVDLLSGQLRLPLAAMHQEVERAISAAAA